MLLQYNILIMIKIQACSVLMLMVQICICSHKIHIVQFRADVTLKTNGIT